MTIENRQMIINEKGLHARASAKLVETVERFNANAIISKDDISVSGDSIMGPHDTITRNANVIF